MATSTNDRYVFGHLWKFKHGCPINEDTVSKTITALLKKLGIPGVLHTTRHTVMTGCLKLGIEYSVVESLLNHAPGGTGAVYAKAKSYPLQLRAWTRWAEHIKDVVEGKETAGDGSNILNLFNRKVG